MKSKDKHRKKQQNT